MSLELGKPSAIRDEATAEEEGILFSITSTSTSTSVRMSPVPLTEQLLPLVELPPLLLAVLFYELETNTVEDMLAPLLEHSARPPQLVNYCIQSPALLPNKIAS